MSPDILRAKPERCGHPNGKEKKMAPGFPQGFHHYANLYRSVQIGFEYTCTDQKHFMFPKLKTQF